MNLKPVLATLFWVDTRKYSLCFCKNTLRTCKKLIDKC